MKNPIPNGTRVTTPFKTLHNSKWCQVDIAGRPNTYEGIVLESYKYEGGTETFYTVKFDICTKYGLSRDKLKVLEKERSNKKK